MQKKSWRKIAFAALALSTAVLLMPSADAGKRRRYGSWGSSGSSGSSSSHGSSGSSGSSSSHGSSGSSSSHGSSGSSGSSSSHGSSGSSGSSSSHGSSGSSSSHGSSGSSGGSYSSHGSSGSSSSHGSSGGVIISYSKPVTVAPATARKPATTQPASHKAQPLPPAPPVTAKKTRATLVVKVPEDADVYLVGKKMSTKGTERRFSIPVKEANRVYTYPVRVEVVRDGKTLVSELKQKIRGGKEFSIAVTETDAKDLVALVAQR